MVDISRLAGNWYRWERYFGGGESTITHAGSDISFRNADCQFHLHQNETWWVLDFVDDRGSRSSGVARFSTFGLAEKYLIWDWLTTARSSLSSGALGLDLYKRGYAPGVEVTDLDGAHIELRMDEEVAILISGTATIFSHIMLMSLDELELIGREGSAQRRGS